MRFTSGISGAVNAREATEHACRQAQEQLQGATPDLVCVFASTMYQTSWPSLLSHVHRQLQPRVLIGCSGSGIIGGVQELEWVPAVSVVAAHLPGVRLFPFAVTPDELTASVPGGFWVDKIGASPLADPVFLLFADPYTTDPMKLLTELNATYRARPIVGGLVSGGSKAGEHLLFFDTQVRTEGAVGVAMTGNITMDTIVSQGCRPIGRPYVVTKAEDNVVWQLGGRQAVEVLHEVLSTLSTDDRELAQQGALFVGLVINDVRNTFVTGDFLIRNIIGLDPSAGAMAINNQVQVGQMFQFHLRDASTSRDELRRLLEQRGHAQPTAGALFFNCTGRGKSLYGVPHHDIKTIQTVAGTLPIGGFFCNGEIGPVGGINFLHGYTASLGLFRPLDFRPSA
jgi:small ligand-binding sensory domain FIST